MTRRDNGEGSVRQRSDGTWEGRISLPDGTRRSFYGATRAEAVARLKQAKADREHGLVVVSAKQTVGDFLASWLESMNGQVRYSSLRRYTDYVGRLTNGLGHIQLGALTAQHIQAFITRERNEGLSNTTLNKMHVVLKQALATAVRMRLVPRNVAREIKAPRPDTPPMQTLTVNQAREFLAYAQSSPRYYPLFVLALSTGLRQGELLALHWGDVDLANRLIHVRYGLQEQDDGSYKIAETKTKGSRRDVAISQYAAVELSAHYDTVPHGPLDLVFPTRGGGVKQPTEIRAQFRALLKRAGLPQIRFHDLRHTAATLMIQSGVNTKVVSEMLGHTRVDITLRVYTHVTPGMQHAAQGTMQRLLQTPDEDQLG